MNKALLVVGMHRSGTSALTGALSILGVDIGEELLPAKSDENEKGFFELKEVHSFHERLLLSGGRTWDAPWPLAPSWLDRVATPSRKAELRGILERNFADSELWAVKDPRLCQLLPMWREVLTDLGVDPTVVHIVRQPEAVAASLARRDGFTGEKSGLLWLDHNATAEHDSRGLQRVFVTYEGLLDSKMDAMEDLAARLNIAWPRDTRTTAAEIEDFLTGDLDHRGRSTSGQVREFGRWAEVVAALYRLLQDLSETGGSGEVFDSDFDQIRARQMALQADFDPTLLDHCTRLVLGTGGLNELELTLDAAEREIAGARAYAKQVEESLGLAQVQEADAREFIASLGKEIEAHRLHADEIESYTKTLESDLQEKETLIRALEEDSARKAGLITGHEKMLREAARYARSLESELEKHQNQQKELTRYTRGLESELEKHRNQQKELTRYTQGLESELEKRQSHQKELTLYTQRLLSELEKQQSQQREFLDLIQSLEDPLEHQKARQPDVASRTDAALSPGPSESQRPDEPKQGHD